jgi:hypothetical protein
MNTHRDGRRDQNDAFPIEGVVYRVPIPISGLVSMPRSGVLTTPRVIKNAEDSAPPYGPAAEKA